MSYKPTVRIPYGAHHRHTILVQTKSDAEHAK